jgi:xanthine dehydrogenase accessory factor
MKRDVLDTVRTRRAEKLPTALVSALDGSWQSVVSGDAQHIAGDLLPDGSRDDVLGAFAKDRSRPFEANGTRAFVQVFNPPLRMLIIGAVHISQHLAPMATLAGYDVVVIDPRRSFAADHRFPSVAMHKTWPDDALRTLDIDRRTAVVTLTHDPKLDDPALMIALRSSAFYIGSLGSRRTHASRCERLTEKGYTDAELGRIHAPVGLDIGAISPAEIAVSVLAQVTNALRRGT